MIDLVFSKGNVFIWSAEDWLKLRQNFRIVGELIGCLPKCPRQDILLGLPLLLSPEEATLLLELKVARLVSYACMLKKPTEALQKAFEEYRQKIFAEQEECLKEQRKKQILNVMDKIVEGKRRKILGMETTKKKIRKPLDKETQEALDSIEIDKESIIRKEMAKLPKLEKTEALVQIPTAYPWFTDEDVKIVDWNYPNTTEETLRYKTFKDLWDRSFYVTSGEKFGGDFLAYPGDPIMFHSQFIIHCKSKYEEMPITEIISQCRVGCHVRKTVVFATLSGNGETIDYQSLQWAESKVLKNVPNKNYHL